MHRYRNAFHQPNTDQYGPEFYDTDAEPTDYKGFQIYERIKGVCFDCVIDGECVANRAGLSGAHKYIDNFWLIQNAA